MWCIWGVFNLLSCFSMEDREVSFVFDKLEKNKQHFCWFWDRWTISSLSSQYHSFHLFLYCVWLPLQCPKLYSVPFFVFAFSSDCRNESSSYFQFQQPLLSTNLRFRLQVCHRMLFFWKIACNSFCCLLNFKNLFLFSSWCEKIV